jgi:hypothetical protein
VQIALNCAGQSELPFAAKALGARLKKPEANTKEEIIFFTLIKY